jgi:hypothetical protein
VLTAFPTSMACTAASDNEEIQIYALDMLVSEGEDIRKLTRPASSRERVGLAT